MQPDFRELRLRQLDRSFSEWQSRTLIQRPPKGWIQAIREALGISSAELANKLGASRQLVLQQEKAEAEDRITLKSLRALADGLDCDLVYAIVPRSGSLQVAAENRLLAEAKSNVMRVEHSMALEDQANKNLEEAINAEVRRLKRKRRTS